MRLIIQDERIVAVATDGYTGPLPYIEAPESYDPARMDDYRVRDGVLVIDVPRTVTMRQARLALLSAGLLDDVDEALASIPDEAERRAALIAWEYAAEVERDDHLVQSVAQAIGLSADQLDQLFAAARSL